MRYVGGCASLDISVPLHLQAHSTSATPLSALGVKVCWYLLHSHQLFVVSQDPSCAVVFMVSERSSSDPLPWSLLRGWVLHATDPFPALPLQFPLQLFAPSLESTHERHASVPSHQWLILLYNLDLGLHIKKPFHTSLGASWLLSTASFSRVPPMTKLTRSLTCFYFWLRKEGLLWLLLVPGPPFPPTQDNTPLPS